ncbi:MAG: 50S ribosomal protein L11 methyltransferase [Gemmatimonadaceae bacterium]
MTSPEGLRGAAGRPWIALRVEDFTSGEAVSSALFEAGSQGVHEDGGALVTHFPPDQDIDAVAARIREVDPAASLIIGEAPILDWSEWRASVRSHHLGRLTLAPPWLADETDQMQVVIDPAMAFGTGEHATTRGVVRLMQQLPEMPATVADAGAGSAVLAICAARLGASTVFAIELDHDAIGNAESNVEQNGVAGRVHVLEGDASVFLPLVAPVGLVLANIISSVLVSLLPVIHDSLEPGGHAILSGILAEEKASMLAELGKTRWRVISDDEEESWWSVLIKRLP